jgi:hypothetical protein
VVRLLSWLDRLAGRFNRWFGLTAVASGTEQGGWGGSQPINATGVKLSLGQIEERPGSKTDE